MRPLSPILLAVLLILIGCSGAPTETEWSQASPDGRITVTVTSPGSAATGEFPPSEEHLHYRVDMTLDHADVNVIGWSPLGIQRADADFSNELSFLSREDAQLTEKYRLMHGKRSDIESPFNEMTLAFENSSSQPVEIIFRIFNDGVAFRYRFPETGDAEQKTVLEESTGIRIPENAVGFLQPHNDPSKYTPAYETFFQTDVAVGTSSPNSAGWSIPALFSLNDDRQWVLYTEAELDGSYCATRLAQNAPKGLYRVRFPDPAEGEGIGEVHPTSVLPWSTPWRVLIIGESLATVVESTLVTDLSSERKVSNTDWIQTGRSAWSWWSDNDSPKNYDRMTPFIDLAQEMGWEYFLVDANWDEMGEGAIERIVEYGKERNVAIWLWYNSGGPHNVVTEKVRDRMLDPEVRRQEMQWLSDIGVKGIKVDFFQSDKQDRIQQYIDILEDAAEFQIMVNFHGCTVPRGWTRTYPHLLSMEAVRGAESYIYDKSYPENAVWHNTVLPFTRNVVGPMDYTPVTFSDNTYPRLTTAGHELALSVVFESAALHPADAVQSYRGLSKGPRDFLRGIPVTWDETRLLSGRPGDSVIIARRSGEAWYIAGLNGRREALTISLSFSFLGEGSFQGQLIKDGPSRDTFAEESLAISPADTQEIELAAAGGFVLVAMRE
ncbi:MAG: glycoside hydrolase family 97 catalytic domain-containing protein [Acidobacteriota bacterium]|nr:MAG: glycoside hydrolase family 97 catalytic domain-containing protein [Acidobacteriota bacterium]